MLRGRIRRVKEEFLQETGRIKDRIKEEMIDNSFEHGKKPL